MITSRLFRYIAIASIPLSMVACAGGGGGGSSSSSNGNVTTSATGFSGQSTWASTSGGQVTSVGTYNQATSGLTYTETVNSANIVQSNSFTSAAGTTVSFNRANGDTIQNFAVGPLANKAYYEANANLDNVAIITPASLNGWSYQSYGVWISGYSGTSGTVGGGSAGSLTTGIAIPTSGTATFTGNTAGVYVNWAGQPYLTGSNLTLTTDFAARTLAFATTGTQALVTGGSSFVAANGLNMTGSLSYASGANLITGSIATAGQGPGSAGNAASMTGGTATGKFYGPAANEVGGTFAVRAASGVESYAGAFGAKR